MVGKGNTMKTKILFVPDKESLTDENSIRIRKELILDRRLTCEAKMLLIYMQLKATSGEEFDEGQAVLDLFSGEVDGAELLQKGWDDGR
jgi:hypothetical protein